MAGDNIIGKGPEPTGDKNVDKAQKGDMSGVLQEVHQAMKEGQVPTAKTEAFKTETPKVASSDKATKAGEGAVKPYTVEEMATAAKRDTQGYADSLPKAVDMLKNNGAANSEVGAKIFAQTQLVTAHVESIYSLIAKMNQAEQEQGQVARERAMKGPIV